MATFDWTLVEKMKLALFTGVYVLLFICIGCRKKEINIRTEPVLESFQVNLPDKLQFSNHSIIDQEKTNLVVYHCLVPENWICRDYFYWDTTDTKHPARYEASYLDSINKMNIRVYADMQSSFTIGPKGSHGKKQPQNVLQGIKDLIQKVRSGVSYEIISEKLFSTPKLQNEKFGSEFNETGKVRIAYNEKNVLMEEEFYGKLTVAEMSSQSFVPMRTTNWSLDELSSCKAPKGKLETCRTLAFTLIASNQPTLVFYNLINQLPDKISKLGFQQAMLSVKQNKTEQQMNDEIPQAIVESYVKNENSREMINSSFSQNFGRIDLYKDENRNSIHLPSGYNTAWRNESGDVMLIRDSNFDPNANSSGNWKILEKF